MPILMNLNSMIERLSAAIPELDLTGDEQREYRTMLLRLQSTIEAGEPNQRIVNECLAYFAAFTCRAA